MFGLVIMLGLTIAKEMVVIQARMFTLETIVANEIAEPFDVIGGGE